MSKTEAIGEPLMAEIGTYTVEDLQKKAVQDTLAEKFSCSVRTVKRYIKKAVAQKSENELTAADKAFLQKNHITIPTRLQGKLSELDYLKRYMTDDEEGWRYTRQVGKVTYEGNGMYYAGIVYFDSKDELLKYLDVMTKDGLQFLWIWHDLDYWQHDSPEDIDTETGTLIFEKGERYRKGSLKRYHAHIMIKWGRLVTWSTNQSYVNQVFGLHTVMWIKVLNPSGMYNYFCHDTSAARAEGKYLYPRSDRVAVNGFDIKLSDREKGEIISGVITFILDDMFATYHRYELVDLLTYYKGQVDMLNIIRGSANLINALLASARNTSYVKRIETEEK